MPAVWTRRISVGVLAVSSFVVGLGAPGASPAQATSKAPSVAPLPVAIAADGPAWQSFVNAALGALASHDGSSAISAANASAITSQNLTFSTGPHAGTTASLSSIFAFATDSNARGPITLTLIDGGQEGLAAWSTGCVQPNGASSGDCTLIVADLSQPSDASSATFTQTYQPFSESALTGDGSTSSISSPGFGASASQAAPASPECTGYIYAPTVVGSGFGPLINFTGVVNCNGNATLQIYLGLYDFAPSCECFKGTGYAAGNGPTYTSSLSASGYAPCNAPYNVYNDYENAGLTWINGYETGQVNQGFVNCALLVS